MVEFIDGPAKGAKLNLRRTPKFLRVVIDVTGNVDALDLKTDRAQNNEKVYAYRAVDGSQQSGFLCGCGKPVGGCVLFCRAVYNICKEQPDDCIMRHRALWEQWVESVNLSESVK